MAEETVVKESLSNEMIESGKSVLEDLDRRRFRVDAALWLYVTDSNEWRLLLATPKVHIDGPKKAYKRLLQTLRDSGVHGVTYDNVAVVDSRDPLIQLLRRAVSKNRSMNGIRFSRYTINGQFIEDAYIYRMAA